METLDLTHHLASRILIDLYVDENNLLEADVPPGLGQVKVEARLTSQQLQHPCRLLCSLRSRPEGIARLALRPRRWRCRLQCL